MTSKINSGLDVTSFDPDVRPQDDLFAHVNNTWMANHPIPEDKSRYGAFDMLREASEKAMRDIIEEAAGKAEAAENDGTDAGPATQKVGDLYRSFMDTERIATLGTSPILEDLAVIAGLTDKRDLLMLLGHLERYGMGGLFGFYVSADAKNSDEYIVYLGQSGLGLPDEAYYREEQYAEIRDKYAAHMERLLTLVGVENADEVAPRVYEDIRARSRSVTELTVGVVAPALDTATVGYQARVRPPGRKPPILPGRGGARCSRHGRT